MKARRDSGLEGYMIGRDSGLEGFRTKGIQEKRDTGKKGYRNGGKRERRVQDIRYAEQERCWTGGMQERRYS